MQVLAFNDNRPQKEFSDLVIELVRLVKVSEWSKDLIKRTRNTTNLIPKRLLKYR